MDDLAPRQALLAAVSDCCPQASEVESFTNGPKNSRASTKNFNNLRGQQQKWKSDSLPFPRKLAGSIQQTSREALLKIL